MIILRPDQMQLKADVYNAWSGGARHVLAVLPTGGGKSIISSDITLDQERAGLNQVVIAHRTELVSQMSLHVANRGIYHRVIAPRSVVAAVTNDHRREFGRSFVNPDARCSVAGVDTLIARAAEIKLWADQIDVWTIDEAHHVVGGGHPKQKHVNKWGYAIAMFPRARGLGVTATPQRGDGMGLGSHDDGPFDVMVSGPSMRQLIEMMPPALTDYQIVCPPSDLQMSEDDIGPSGEFSPKKLAEKSEKSHIVGDVVDNYVKYAFGKRAICFATDVKTANNIAQNFNERGIPAASVSAKTPSDVRADYIRKFRNGQIYVLVNVDLFGEGFDVPACEVVIMARPTASLGLYLQMFGRALRTLPGKLYGLIIDHVSNVKRHGLPDKPHYWTLDRRDKRAKKEKDPEDIETTVCRSCSRPYPRDLPACQWCGEAPPIAPPGGRTIQMVDGDLILLDRDKLEAMRKAMVLPSPADVGNRALHVAGPAAAAGAVQRQIEKHAAQSRLTDAIAAWAGVQRHHGRSDAQSYRKFYLTTGVDVLTALSAERTRADYDALADKVEGWMK